MDSQGYNVTCPVLDAEKLNKEQECNFIHQTITARLYRLIFAGETTGLPRAHSAAPHRSWLSAATGRSTASILWQAGVEAQVILCHEPAMDVCLGEQFCYHKLYP